MIRFCAGLFVTLGIIAGAGAASVAGSLEQKPLAIAHVGLVEPLVATGPATDAERQALTGALAKFDQRADVEDFSSLVDFLRQYPHGAWAASVSTNLGLSYLHDGYFSRALDAWRTAWTEGRTATDPNARSMVDRAVGELARLDANLGHTTQLAALFTDIGKRPVSGSATEAIQAAREQLALVDKDPRHLFNCGPLALRALALAENTPPDQLNFLQFYNAGVDGTTLAELSGLADRTRLPHHLIDRSVGEPVPVPSVVHWKVGHFAAIIGKANGRYEVRDAVFPGSDIWVTQAALDEEASGYFLVPAEVAQSDKWKTVDLSEAATIHGKGPTSDTRPGDAGDPDANTNGSGKPCPLCAYNIKEASVSISLSDVPVGYTPPIGPSMKVGISYNQREDSQPANFSYSNVGPKWTLSWLSYVTDDPSNVGANVSRVQGEGGAFYYIGFNAAQKTFAPQDDDGSILAITNQAAISYRRLLQDGSVEIYAQSDGSASYPRKIFLSQVIDPQGNAATLHYDSLFRLTSITDAVGRDTTFSYGLSDEPLLVTKISDPFNRSAVLTYDSLGRLNSITDIIGLTSSFTYDANSLVDSMTTPYGVTHFSYTAPGTASPPRFVQVTDPMGFKEREEWLEPAPIPSSDPSATVPVGMPIGVTNSYLTYRNSFHWNKDQYVAAGCTDSGGCDYTKARIKHFVHMPGTSTKGTVVESEKEPLENRVWYNYPGQTSAIGALYGGTYSKPTAVGRVLDDGTTQLTQFAYDPNGYNLVQKTDPLGRTTKFAYANNIDVAAVTQVGPAGTALIISQSIYNGIHRPLFSTDAAGRTTSYQYNAAGQVTKATDPLGEQTSWQYDSTANLVSVTNANSAIAKSYTYDAFNRVRTVTDSEGWSLTYDYDAADRVTKVTYPDGTFTRYTYDRLDLASYRDREDRLWEYSHDSNRRVTSVVNPMQLQTSFGYNNLGQPTTLTDAKGYITTLAYDLDGRQISKTFANSSAITYTYESTIGRLKSVLDPLGQTKQYSYANDDSPLGVTYANAINATPNVAFTYDSYFPRLTSMTDGTGVTNYSYNPIFVDGALQRQSECFTASTATSCTHEIDYGYDELERLHTRTIVGSGPEIYSYDSIGRLSGHSSDLGSFAINYLGQTSQKTVQQLLPTGSNLKTTWAYLDNAHDRRLSSISNAGLSAGQYSNFSFDTTPENFITGITQTSDATVDYPPAATQTASFNNLNQLSTLDNSTIIYDANGNLLTDGQRNYSWDAENRLVAISYPAQSGKATTFGYNALSQRTSISSTPAGGGVATTTSYVWCGSRLCQARNAMNSPTRDYYAEGELIPGTSTQAYFYGLDQIGSVRRVFASTTSAPAYDFDPYGNAIQSTPPTSDHGFAGMFYNSDSGLYLTQFRAYDSVAGRWLTRDPSGEETDQSRNLYTYVNSNPISERDPTGRFGIWGGAAGFLIGGAGDLGYQLYRNGGNFACIDWWEAAGAAGVGAAVGSGAEALAGAAGLLGDAAAVGLGESGAASSLQGYRLSQQLAAEEAAGATAPSSISGYTDHALEQIAGRDGGVGVSQSALEDAFANPNGIQYAPSKYGATFRYRGDNATVVVNPQGSVVTGWARNSAGIGR